MVLMTVPPGPVGFQPVLLPKLPALTLDHDFVHRAELRVLAYLDGRPTKHALVPAKPTRR